LGLLPGIGLAGNHPGRPSHFRAGGVVHQASGVGPPQDDFSSWFAGERPPREKKIKIAERPFSVKESGDPEGAFRPGPGV